MNIDQDLHIFPKLIWICIYFQNRQGIKIKSFDLCKIPSYFVNYPGSCKIKGFFITSDIELYVFLGFKTLLTYVKRIIILVV